MSVERRREEIQNTAHHTENMTSLISAGLPNPR